MDKDLRQRISEIDRQVRRLSQERANAQRKLASLATQGSRALVRCPRCGRDHDFLTDEGGYLAHVLEDPQDQELLAPGKPLYCPGCGDVFLFVGAAGKSGAKKRRGRK